MVTGVAVIVPMSMYALPDTIGTERHNGYTRAHRVWCYADRRYRLVRSWPVVARRVIAKRQPHDIELASGAPPRHRGTHFGSIGGRPRRAPIALRRTLQRYREHDLHHHVVVPQVVGLRLQHEDLVDQPEELLRVTRSSRN